MVAAMERLIIEGGRPLEGSVEVHGAKNAALPLLAGTVLSAGDCVFDGVPQLVDVAVMLEILEQLGAQVRREGGTLTIAGGNVDRGEVSEGLVRRMRSSIFLMGPLLARLGRVVLSYPGGCAIGPRPIDLHLAGLAAMGARIHEDHGYIHARADRLMGADIHLDFPSVGATENLMMAASLARGTTWIRNAAREPELVDLANFLNAMGARVQGAGSDCVRVEGVRELGGVRHRPIPDRIEAGTLLAAAAITGGEVCLHRVRPEHLTAVTAKLRKIGAAVEEAGDGMRLRGPVRPRATNLRTLPYPGFPTDLQPQMVALLSLAEGTSLITENIFENRFGHVEELRRMGAQLTTEGRSLTAQGVERLSGARVVATDLRSGAALVLAGLAAQGRTVVEGVDHVDRGYQALEETLVRLGARIRRERLG